MLGDGAQEIGGGEDLEVAVDLKGVPYSRANCRAQSACEVFETLVNYRDEQGKEQPC